MKKKHGFFWIIFGAVLLIAALSLVLYNWNQDHEAGESTQEILSELKEEIAKMEIESAEPVQTAVNTEIESSIDNMESEIESATDEWAVQTQAESIYQINTTIHLPEGDLFQEYQQPIEETVPEERWITVNEFEYIGVITIPTIGIEVPVLAEWSYPNLRMSPCRYSGTIAEGNMIIAAHNYNTHFGKIKALNSGDLIYFTDCDGNTISYEVIQSDLIDGNNAAQMEVGTDIWDLTLFTCTLSGQNRVTVRARRIGGT